MDDNKYRSIENIEITQFGEEQIVFNPNSQTVHILNRTSAEILRFIESPSSVADIKKELREKYGEIDALDEDVSEMLSEFIGNGLAVAYNVDSDASAS